MKRKIIFFSLFWLTANIIVAQTIQDTIKTATLPVVNIKIRRETIERLPSSQNGYLWSGKKSEVINLQNLDANIAEKTPRQIFAKVPGVFVYDMDGTGNQTNISTRGLDPHRGWEFNIRTDGILTNSDIYGYPASHFSLPMEAVGRIELVRGTGALQYGAQFGGMLQYIIKQPDTTRKINLETIQSVGSYGLISNYTAIGGKLGKFQYYAFYNKRVSQGYRQNSDSDYDGQGLVLKYTPSKNFFVRAELLRSNYTYHIPGPLTDAMFQADPRQSTRSRNYFNPEIFIPSFSIQWKPGEHTHIGFTASATLGERRSVMVDRVATVRDSINAATRQFNPRQVDIDGFNSKNMELRLLQDYSLLGHTSSLAVAVQYIHNDLNRRQLGKGTTGSDYDLTIDASGWGRDLFLKSRNIAFSVENNFRLTENWSVSPGFRFESGNSKLSGKTTYYDPADLTNTIKRNFPLLGINTELITGKQQMLYAGFSQAYRPVIFKDIIPGSVYEQSDKNLKDAFGYNAELGWRGKSEHFKWDVSAFTLSYNNRLGSLSRYDGDIDTFVLFRTNIGDSRTNGLEVFVEYGTNLLDNVYASIFTSTAYFDAEYTGDSLRASGKENRSIKGNRLESVPKWISRNGGSIRYKQFSASFLYSYTSSTFADPFNTVEPSATGAVGKVPAYGLLDLNASLRIRTLTFRVSLNNLTNKQYFTKRPTFYPGPGIWPSDGRSVVCSVAVTL
jgi:Fe(3+) dicitrate transport protein